VLITASLGDSVLPVVGASQVAMLEQIPDSRLFLAKQGDHPLMWSNPVEFRRAVDVFLDSLSL
jgi:pimeloyl-ACP methyl ester carboxylesterase